MAQKRTDSTPDVAAFMQALKHSRKDEIEAVRAVILAADGNITEHIKWNAPSFCIDGDDRITFRLQPGDRVQLIFHRGAKKRGDKESFTFEDKSGLLEWVTVDRGVVTFHNFADVTAKRELLHELVKQWVSATRDHS
ncbi:MAG: DUF1801 domain-containing protein [Limnochordia bacterium]